MNKGQVKITATEYRRRFCKSTPFPFTTWKQPKEIWGRSPGVEAMNNILKFVKNRFRSEWEREFALWITAQGWPWKYEAVRLRLADRTTYLPDFWVPWPGHKIEIYEVKGRKWPAAMVKFKVAKEQYPEFKFYLVTKNHLGGWIIS